MMNVPRLFCGYHIIYQEDVKYDIATLYERKWIRGTCLHISISENIKVINRLFTGCDFRKTHIVVRSSWYIYYIFAPEIILFIAPKWDFIY